MAKDNPLELNDDALKFVLSNRAGRRFLWNLLGTCGLVQNPFAGDNNTTNFNCGRLSVATSLLVDITRINPDAFSLMSKEAKEDEEYVRGTTTVGEHDPIGAVSATTD